MLINVDETVGIGNRLLAEERRVDEAEDGGIGADAEAEDQDGGCRESPIADEPADGVPGVVAPRRLIERLSLTRSDTLSG